MKTFFLRFWPLFFIAFLWFVFSAPYFLQKKVPYASTYQTNFFAPWSYYGQFDGPIKNGAMPDVHSQIYPWKKFTIDTLQKGEIPFWNPYSFAGNPHLANFQSALLTPFNLLFFVLPFVDAWSILVLLQPALAGLFMYLFMRSLGASKIGSVIGSVSFMFCGFIVVWMAYGTLAYTILYLPLALFAIERYGKIQKKRFLVLLTLTIPLSFFSGHFQISLYFLVALVSYVLFKGILTKKLPVTCFLLLATFIGLLLSLPQLLPSIELYRHAVRSELFQISEAIPFQYLITIVAPDFFGNPVTRNDWFGHYAEWAGFIGVIPLLLGVYAVASIKNQKSKFEIIIFFAVTAVVSLLLAINSPLSNLIVTLKIPVISTSALSRVIVLFSFAFGVLSGFGFDQLVKDTEKKTVRLGLIIFAGVAVFLITIWLLVLFSHVYPSEWLIVAKRNFVLPTALFLVGACILLAAAKQKKFMVLAAGFLLLASSFDSFRFAQKWMPFDPKEFVYPNVAIVDMIKKHIGEGRIFGNLGGEATTYYGFPSIEGYDPLYIGRYGEFIRSATSGDFLNAERSVAKLQRDARYADRVLDLLGVTLLFHPIADTNQGWAYPVWRDQKRYSIIYQDDTFQLFRNNMALPRAMLFYNYEVLKDDRDIINKFYSEDFDFRRVLILEDDPHIEPAKSGQGDANIISYTPNKVVIKIKTGEPALLFLSDNYYPNWKSKVNGKEVLIYRSDYTFRSVVVPSGESEVEFSYENWHF